MATSVISNNLCSGKLLGPWLYTHFTFLAPRMYTPPWSWPAVLAKTSVSVSTVAIYHFAHTLEPVAHFTSQVGYTPPG